MKPGAQLQNELARVVTTLRRRRASSADAREQKTLARIIGGFDKEIAVLDQLQRQDERLAVADSLADAQHELESAVAALEHGPFDGYLAALAGHFDNLSLLSATLHALDALPPAPDDGLAAPVRSADAPPAARRGATRRARGALPAIARAPATATDFAALHDEYTAWYAACEVRPERRGELAYYLKRLTQGQAVYTQLGSELGIPWVFIGITHGMECGFNFNCHLHNGDPLGARTMHVPKDRPATGNAPFTWSESARDALIYKAYHQVGEWSVAHMLYLFERYNGMGYRRRGVPTPYLWSFSNLYEKGKFVADGRFDPQAVSKQCGAALMLKAVLV